MSDEQINLYSPIRIDHNHAKFKNFLTELSKIGCSTGNSGSSNSYQYSSAITDFEFVESSNLSHVIDDIISSGAGTIKLWCEGMDLLLGINLNSSIFIDQPNVTFLFDPVYFRKNIDDLDWNENVNILLRLARVLYENFTPEFIVALTHIEYDRFERGSLTKPDNEGFWLQCIPKNYIDKNIDELDVWSIRQLNDSLLIVATSNPLDWSNSKSKELRKNIWQRK